MQEKKIFLLKKFALSLHSQSGNNDSDVLVMLKKNFEKSCQKIWWFQKLCLTLHSQSVNKLLHSFFGG